MEFSRLLALRSLKKLQLPLLLFQIQCTQFRNHYMLALPFPCVVAKIAYLLGKLFKIRIEYMVDRHLKKTPAQPSPTAEETWDSLGRFQALYASTAAHLHATYGPYSSQRGSQREAGQILGLGGLQLLVDLWQLFSPGSDICNLTLSTSSYNTIRRLPKITQRALPGKSPRTLSNCHSYAIQESRNLKTNSIQTISIAH